MRNVIELLSPARDYKTGCAAIDCGADAVYIGAPEFGARHAAGNTVEDIARLVRYARPFGVRVYATFNTVLTDDETRRARELAQQTIDAGVDALIVQDMAYMRMGLQGVEMHASTQMCNTSARWAGFLAACGFSRVILERNLSLDRISDIARNTDVDLECFVHGAVCVGYSGRCFLSRSMGERSGNRGQCSQPCRLAYDLEDGTGRKIRQGVHLLSVQDLNLSDRIGRLLDAGVSSFKIEGRLKDELYVRNTTACYRRIIDRQLSLRPHLRRSSAGESRPGFEPDLRKGFARMQGRYFMDGLQPGVASLSTPKSVGERLGRVTATGADWFETDSRLSAAPGDGICFVSAEGLCGTGINRVQDRRIWPNRMDGIRRGAEIFRNFDAGFAAQVSRGGCRRTIDVVMNLRAGLDRAELQAVDCHGIQAQAGMQHNFEAASDTDRMLAVMRAQLSKSGDTIFRVTDVRIDAAQMPFVPASMLNALRRQVLDELLRKRAEAAAPREIRTEDPDVRCPVEIDRYMNVTNSLSRGFFQSHGAAAAPALELARSLAGSRVMTTRYCIRRELGMCLKEPSAYKGELFLVHGTMRYRLQFDCRECMMNIYADEKR